MKTSKATIYNKYGMSRAWEGCPFLNKKLNGRCTPHDRNSYGFCTGGKCPVAQAHFRDFDNGVAKARNEGRNEGYKAAQQRGNPY